MTELSSLGKALVALGALLVVLGAALWLGPKVPFLGRLPGDIVIKRENFTLYFPLATMLLLSLLATVLLNLLWRR